MYLIPYSTPTSRVRATTVSGDSVPAADDRVWVILHNPGTGPVDVCLLGAVPSMRLSPGETMVMPSPVWLGLITATGSGSLTVTEGLRNDAG